MDCPETEIDPWSDEALLNPYPLYEALRELGPVIWMPHHNAYLVTRYDEVRKVLLDWETYCSGKGVGLSPEMNARAGHGILSSDPPIHDTRRRVLNAQLVPREVAGHRDLIVEIANRMVSDAVARGSFDVVADLAAPFSLKVVADLVGLPERVGSI